MSTFEPLQVFCRPRRQAEWWVAALNLAGAVGLLLEGMHARSVTPIG